MCLGRCFFLVTDKWKPRFTGMHLDRLFTMIKTFCFFVFNKCLKAMQLCCGSSTAILEQEVHVVFFPPKFTSTLLKPDLSWHAFYKNNGMMRAPSSPSVHPRTCLCLIYVVKREVTSLSVWQLGHKNPACLMFCPQIHHNVNYKYEVWPKHAGWNVPANLYKCFSTLSFQPWALAPPKV